MALSDKEVLSNLKKGTVIIHPFDRANLATSSYDVTLGEWYFREQSPKAHKKIYNIYSKDETARVWHTTALRARFAKDALASFNIEFDGIRPDDKVILLEPGETILAHTEEFIGGRENVTTMMKSRSSLGRNFVNVCKCAGWGDVGYVNRWTMEISNASQHYIIPLVVGRRIAQLIFFETGPIAKKDYTKQGKYASSTDLKKLIRDWRPVMMLPKLWMDRDVRKKQPWHTKTKKARSKKR